MALARWAITVFLGLACVLVMSMPVVARSGASLVAIRTVSLGPLQSEWSASRATLDASKDGATSSDSSDDRESDDSGDDRESDEPSDEVERDESKDDKAADRLTASPSLRVTVLAERSHRGASRPLRAPASLSEASGWRHAFERPPRG